MKIQSNMRADIMMPPLMMDMNTMMQMSPKMLSLPFDPSQMMNMNMRMEQIPNNMMNNNPQDLNINKEKNNE